MRVALLVTDLQLGGTPLRVARLAVGIQQAGLELLVACLPPRGPVSDRLDSAGLLTFAADAAGPLDFAALWRLRRRLVSFRPELIHSFLTHANVAARIVGRTLGLPVIGSTATIEVERHWHRFAERVTLPLESAHMVNSQSLALHVREQFGASRDRVIVVPPSVAALHPVDRAQARNSLALPAQAIVIACVARFDVVKRLDIAIRCAELLTDLNVYLVLAGEGPDGARLGELVTTSPARERIHVIGWQNDPALVLCAADLLLLCSRTEGMPNAVLEAMSLGLPVVASDLPTLRELAGDEGRITLVRGQEREFASAIRDALSDPHATRQKAQRARRWAAVHLDPQANVAATIAAYESVVSEWRATRGPAAP